MSAIFPKWTSRLPAILIVGGALTATSVVGGLWYYFTPKYTRVGYQPVQPVGFPHSVHVDQLGLDCRYCHSAVEKSWYSNVPSSSTCMNCHNQVLKDDSRLALVRESAASGKPVPWVQVHKVPDYVYFNHSVHIARGVSCISCHGEIHKMDEVRHAKPLSMTFCLDCHRNPEQNIRPTDKVTQLDWVFDTDPHAAAEKQKKFGDAAVKDWKVNASQNCSACHR
jgi:hypothetical protein